MSWAKSAASAFSPRSRCVAWILIRHGRGLMLTSAVARSPRAVEKNIRTSYPFELLRYSAVKRLLTQDTRSESGAILSAELVRTDRALPYSRATQCRSGFFVFQSSSHVYIGHDAADPVALTYFSGVRFLVRYRPVPKRHSRKLYCKPCCRKPLQCRKLCSCTAYPML